MNAGFLHFALRVKKCFIFLWFCCAFLCSNFVLCGQTGKAASKIRKTSPGTSANGDKQEESDTQPGRTFVPFNYSDVDYSTFTGKKVHENSVTCSTRILLVY